MKKVNRFQTAAILACSAMCLAFPVAVSADFAGDVNLDEQVTLTDAVLLQKYLLGKETLSEEAYQNADLHADQVVNVFDLLALKKQIISSTPDVPPEVEPTEPGPEIVDPSGKVSVSSVVYETDSVALYDAEGNEVSPTSAANVSVSGTVVTVTAGGEYTFSGNAENGQLKVCTDDETEPDAAVTLNFNDLSLTNENSAPVYVENVGDEVTISLQKGTVNTISDGTTHTDTYTNSDGETKNINGAIFSRDDLKIKGKGTLVVNGNAEDGIVSKNDLKLWNGTIEVTAQDDGIRGENSVRIGDPDDLVENGGDGDFSNLNLTVKTNAGDGIKSTETEEGKGYITINGGTINVNSYADGIQAEQEFTMNGGELTIFTYEGSDYGNSSSGNNTPWGGGGMQEGNANKTDISAKGIKAVGLYDEAGTTWQSAGNITINGGNLTINSSDDSIHCGGAMQILGGNFTIATADDGFHSDHELTIGNETAAFDSVQIYISHCFEGVEGVTINQNAGTVYIISEDDGYNAAGGSDNSGNGNNFGGFGGWNQGEMSTSTGTMNLNGGLVVVNSANGDHDAFDSNGDVNLNGGYYCANGQDPMDCGDNGNTINYNGGNVITLTAGNTNLNTRYSFLDEQNQVIVSFLSGSGNAGQNCTTCTAFTGGTVSDGETILEQAETFAVTIGGTLADGTQITAGASSGGGFGGNPGGGAGGFGGR